ncbi:hypothetical protein ACHHYP_12075 [Achlya hypogyna]|uniref:DUF7769 domain-containing protein n=1 Tax=Achlya hypogyna TaxID=1202772 RepID=A0A1V9YHL2_ACHHY|nr:hypothetical protein ACHHYP_12075 [Achlya hypogyna]
MRMPAPHTPASTATRVVSWSSKNLADNKRHAIYEQLLQSCVGGKIPRSAFQKLAPDYGCHARTIARIWAQGQESVANGAVAAVVTSRMKGNCGVTSKWDKGAIERAIKTVPHELRQTLRSLAAKRAVS